MPDNGDGLSQWRSLVLLWQSGLDAAGMSAMLNSLSFSANPPGIHTGAESVLLGLGPGAVSEAIQLARLTGDWDAEQRMRYGAALWEEYQELRPSDLDSQVNSLSSSLIPLIVGMKRDIIIQDQTGMSETDAKVLSALIFNFLRTAHVDTVRIERFIFSLSDEDGRGL